MLLQPMRSINMGYRDYSVAKGHIVDITGHGDFTTIQAAINAASSGQIIYVRPGTYSENWTPKSGVTITAATGFDLNDVIIIGKVSISIAGSYRIDNVTLQTNSDYAIEITGSDAITLNLSNIALICSNHTGINFSNSNAGSVISSLYSIFSLLTTGIATYTSSCPGNIIFYYCISANEGLSITPSSNSAGVASHLFCTWDVAISSSGTGATSLESCRLDLDTENATCLSLTGTAIGTLLQSIVISGTASSVSIGAGCTANITHTVVSSSNANAISGSGTLNKAFIAFLGSSSTVEGTLTVNSLPTT